MENNTLADISQLGELLPTSTLSGDTYKTQSTGFQLPKAGRYTLRSPESFPATSFGKTQASNLSVTLDPTIVGPSNENFKPRYIKVSAKLYERPKGSGNLVSQVGDYLKSVGYTGNIPGDPQELANIVEQTAGAEYEAILDWEASHRASGFKVKGMRNFPLDASGQPQSWVKHPTETVMNDKGEKEPLKLRANIVVDRFIPRTN